MKQGLSLILIFALCTGNLLAQETKKPLPAEEVKAFVENAYKEQKRVKVTLITPNVARQDSFCTDYPRNMGVKILDVGEQSFCVEDHDVFLGDIAGQVAYDNVAAIKIQNQPWRKFVKTTRTTGVVTVTVAAMPVFLVGMAVCAASHAKYARWACPR